VRIVSLLASGTELACALGAGEALVGRSHECDDPPWVTRLPAVSRPTFDVSGASGDIDARVREKLRAGEPLYEIDRERLAALAPDVVITQVHCDVCAVGPEALDPAHGWPALRGFKTVSMRGGSLEGVLADFATVAAAIGRGDAGERLVADLRARVARLGERVAGARRPGVVCLEWTDPSFPMGNWGPELVERAGGTCLLGNANAHSAAVPWQAVLDADPEVLIVAPCGFGLLRAAAEMPALAARPGWAGLRAVRDGQVWVADGNRHFNRSGPALFDTIELLAEILHPALFPRRAEGVWYRAWSSSWSVPTAERALDVVKLCDLEDAARAVLPPGPFDYIAGGAGDEQTLRANRRAFEDWQLLPRHLTGVAAPDTRTTLLGSALAAPLFVAPMASQGLAHTAAERGAARGAADAGVLYCAATFSNVSLEEIAAVAGGPKWFQLYLPADRGVARELLARARAAGYGAIVFTVDLQWAGNRERDRRNGFVFPASLPFPNATAAARGATLPELLASIKRDLDLGDLDFVVAEAGLPVIVKGVLAPDEARASVAHGAAAIAVSNHGGRQLDGAPATITALPAIVDAVGGDVPVLLDGGVRRGVDVLKALALGAAAVGIGRPVLYALALGGAPAVRAALGALRQELELAMKLAGCAALRDITRGHVVGG
jgi:lactate oxidase